jgi:GNAT acetyltransferase-like protein
VSDAASAELIEDRGAAAESEEFFRSRAFLDAEAVTHTLRIEAGDTELLAPLIVREIDDGPEQDATSPYGYPGIVPSFDASDIDYTGAGSISDPSIDPGDVDFSSTGLVSVFLRHTLGDPPLTDTRQRNVVQIADPELLRKSRGSDRNQVNKNLRRGYELRLVAGPRTTAAERAAFLVAYEQTMRRTGAAKRYFFGPAYFDCILSSPRTWLALASAPDGEIAAASIVAQSDDYLHYYLSGSVDSYLRDSPMKNVVTALVDFAVELGMPLNLGGGLSPGDPLEEFKRGFANRELPWQISKIVCDRDAYARLSAGLDAGDYFPAYRAS